MLTICGQQIIRLSNKAQRAIHGGDLLIARHAGYNLYGSPAGEFGKWVKAHPAALLRVHHLSISDVHADVRKDHPNCAELIA